jgi:hypothetical protein
MSRLPQDKFHAKAYITHARLEVVGSSDDILKEIKKKVLQEIDAAVVLDRNSKEWIRSLWRPAEGAEDDDLAVFGPDDEDLKPRLN